MPEHIHVLLEMDGVMGHNSDALKIKSREAITIHLFNAALSVIELPSELYLPGKLISPNNLLT